MKTRRPVILITLCRRYYELSLCLELIEQAQVRGEFYQKPEVWVVWARPELQRLWYFQELREQGKVHRLLTRVQAVPGEQEGAATSTAESHNLRLGLEAIREAYGDDVYVIGMCADVQPRQGTFNHVENLMKMGFRAVLFHWQNEVRHSGIWHTNFFVVPTEEAYWPPVANPELVQDVLERQWGVKLEKSEPPDIHKTNNYSQKFFQHFHLSEAQPPWPYKPQLQRDSIGLCISGYKPWWRRVYEWFFKRT